MSPPGPNDAIPHRDQTMNTETYANIAYALSTGTLEDIDNTPLHSILLYQASAARLLTDHVDPTLHFPALDALTTLGLPDESLSLEDAVEFEIEGAIEDIAQDVAKVESLSAVAFELCTLPLLGISYMPCFFSSPSPLTNYNTQSNHAYENSQ